MTVLLKILYLILSLLFRKSCSRQLVSDREMNHQCGMSSEKKINVFTKEACYPSSKNLVCVKKKKKFFTGQINKVIVTSFTQKHFTAKMYYYSFKIKAHELSKLHHICVCLECVCPMWISVWQMEVSHIFAYKFSLYLLTLWKLWRPRVELIYKFHSLDIPTCLILPVNYWEIPYNKCNMHKI